MSINSHTSESTHLLPSCNNGEAEGPYGTKGTSKTKTLINNFIWGIVGVCIGMTIMHWMQPTRRAPSAKITSTPSSIRTPASTSGGGKMMVLPSTIAAGRGTVANGTNRSGGAGALADAQQPAKSLDTAEASSATSSSPYTKFQPTGFQIYTGGAPAFVTTLPTSSKSNSTYAPKKTMKPNPECDTLDSFGQNADGSGYIQCYLGLEDTTLDIRKRLDIMIHAVEAAYAKADNDDPTTLKIFIAPEFYWRGVDGAYVYTDDDEGGCKEICTILKSLEDYVAQKRFEDWLFVFGTVIVSELLPVEDKYDYLFYNFAPIYKGYDPNSTDHKGKRFIVPKRYVSNIDFLTPLRHFNDTTAKELIQFTPTEGGMRPSDRTVANPYDLYRKQYDRDMWHQYKSELDDLGYTMIEYDWLIMDGITFTIEVCLDHDLKTALNSYLADAVTGSTTRIPSVTTKGAAATSSNNPIQYVPIPKHMAQISIVSSSGMTVNADSLALANGGTIVLQDGLSNGNSDMAWMIEEDLDEQCQQYSWHFIGGSEAVQRHGVISPTEAIFNYNVKTEYTRYPVYDGGDEKEVGSPKAIDWEQALDGVFTTKKYAPEIAVYETINIVQI